MTFLEHPSIGSPFWTPDGEEVVFSWSPDSGSHTLRAARLDGSRTLRDVADGLGVAAYSAGGERLIYDRVGEGFNLNLWHKALGEDGPGEPLLTDEEWEIQPALSPDGRLLAYAKGDAILLRTYPDMGGPWQVATGREVASPRWDPSGDRLYYLSGDDVTEVDVTTRPVVRVGPPRTLFTFRHGPVDEDDSPLFDITSDGESFIMVEALEPIPGLVVVQNWLASVD